MVSEIQAVKAHKSAITGVFLHIKQMIKGMNF
jgi:hypothetical protein